MHRNIAYIQPAGSAAVLSGTGAGADYVKAGYTLKSAKIRQGTLVQSSP